MKKTSNSKLPSPSKLVRRVFSKSSSITVNTNEEVNMEKKKSISVNLETEVSSLRDQVNILQIAVNSMQDDADKKERALANLAREKETLATDLKKQRRSNYNLKQQLEDERTFYYKEKEQYCQEMNDCKKIKKNLIKSEITEKKVESSCDTVQYQGEIAKLKEALNQTLEANYNLSVKFLRMKNTKFCLKNRLKKLQTEHDKAMVDLKIKTEDIKKELSDVVHKQFRLPTSPSNKKYLQIVKQNGKLVHENLCLQIEVDRLTLQLDNFKMLQVKNETNHKLKYINSKSKDNAKHEKRKTVTINTSRKEERAHKSKGEKHKEKKSNGNSKQVSEMKCLQPPITKIYEKDEKSGIPLITMLSQEGAVSEAQENASNVPKLQLLPILENPSQICTEISDYTQSLSGRGAIRTQSAPEIVQTSLFVNEIKSCCNTLVSSINPS